MGRYVTIAPPDGTAVLALIAPREDTEDYALVGKGRFVVFLSDDVHAKFGEWLGRGVRFSHPPQAEEWGGIVTGFEDIDGNRFSLVGLDSASREITAHKRAAQELEAARQVQSRLFPQTKKRNFKKLGRLTDYPTKDSIFPVFQQFMSEANKPEFRPAVGTLLRAFVLESYFPSVESDLRGSTLRGYKAIWRNHLEPRLGHLRIRDVRTYDCQKAMDAIVNANPDLKQATLSRVKSFTHEIFAQAIRLGLREDDVNPASGVKIRGAKKRGKTFAYSLDDIRNILDALTEPTKVLMAVAAYTGLRRGEIVGLKWEDYDGKAISVRRNICFGQRGEMSVELPKTDASEAPVPVIAPLREVLDSWKAKAQVTKGCWIFQAGFTRKKDHPETLLDNAKLTPLSPANVLRDAILPVLRKEKIEWLGYHAFRRGLATNLRALGVDDLTISEILRHSDVAVTRASYIKRVSEKSVEGMSKLEAEIAARPKPVQSVRTDAIVPVGMA